MYNATFVKDNGDTFLLGKDNNIVFDIEGLSGISVDIGTSQGSAQIGESVETQSVNGKSLSVKGVIFSDIQNGKKMLRKAFAAFQHGRLVFGEYYIYVYVQEAPSFSPIKNNGAFTMMLFAPYPFFRSVYTQSAEIGAIAPQFSFPVTYSSSGTHVFGTRSAQKYSNFVNNGDLEVPFSVTFIADSTSTNTMLTNLNTLEKLAISGSLTSGQRLHIYRNDNGVLRAELTSAGVTTDALSMIDETSDLWYLHVGDNLLNISDNQSANNISVIVEYNEAYGGVYEE